MSKCDTQKKESAAARNRAEYPETAKAVDLFRKHFGEDVKVICSTLDGRLLGIAQPPPKRFVDADRWLWQSENLIAPAIARRALMPMLPNSVGRGRR